MQREKENGEVENKTRRKRKKEKKPNRHDTNREIRAQTTQYTTHHHQKRVGTSRDLHSMLPIRLIVAAENRLDCSHNSGSRWERRITHLRKEYLKRKWGRHAPTLSLSLSYKYTALLVIREGSSDSPF